MDTFPTALPSQLLDPITVKRFLYREIWCKILYFGIKLGGSMLAPIERSVGQEREFYQ
jgi:hypothetical protein